MIGEKHMNDITQQNEIQYDDELDMFVCCGPVIQFGHCWHHDQEFYQYVCKRCGATLISYVDDPEAQAHD